MSVELWALYATVILGIAQVLIAAQAATARRGVKWNLSSRERSLPELGGVAGRLNRASKNLAETFPFFAAAVVIVELTGRHSWASTLGAEVFFGARVLYLPVYAAGIVGLRSLIWLVSLVGLGLLLLAPLV